MRAAIITIVVTAATVATVRANPLLGFSAIAPGCPDGWTAFSDPANSEGGPSCLYYGTTPSSYADATKACKAMGAHLLSISSDADYFDANGLLRFAIDGSGCTANPTTPYVAGACPLYWTGAAKLTRAGNKQLSWGWNDHITPGGNLRASCAPKLETDPRRPSGTCGPWGYRDDPSDDSSLVADPNEVDAGGNDITTFPSFCDGFDVAHRQDCKYGAIGYEYFGLVDRTGNTALPYICEIDSDEDTDGVPDFLDWCPGTGSRAKVDANGCTRLDMDPDGDKFCFQLVQSELATAPVTGGKLFEPVLSKWCRKFTQDGALVNAIDNCPFIPNPVSGDVKKAQPPQDGTVCDLAGCSPYCAAGCKARGSARKPIPRGDIRACIAPFNPVTGKQDKTLMCNSPALPVSTTKGCYLPTPPIVPPAA